MSVALRGAPPGLWKAGSAGEEVFTLCERTVLSLSFGLLFCGRCDRVVNHHTVWRPSVMITLVIDIDMALCELTTTLRT